MTELNELEYVNGRVFANIYLTNRVVELDLVSNTVSRSFEFKNFTNIANEASLTLFNRPLSYEECLNGIAYKQDTKRFWITGKDWPILFEVKLAASN